MTTSPEKPSRCRSHPVSSVRETVAGTSDPVTLGTATCAVISPSSPSSIAATNGRSWSTSSSWVSCITGSARWLSASVLPCPGKCFATVTRFPSCWPRM